MDRLIREYELLYKTDLELVTSNSNTAQYQYSFNNNNQTYYLISSKELKENEFKSIIIAINNQLNNNTSIEKALIKGLHNSMEYSDQLVIEELFTKTSSYSLFAIKCHEIEDITTLIYQIVEEALILVKVDDYLIGLSGFNEVELMMKQIVSMIESELMIKVKLYCGHSFKDITKIYDYYNELLEMISLAKLYCNHKYLIFVKDMSFITLVNKLANDSKQSYIDDVLDTCALKELNDEDIKTINSFFDNQLNIAETARDLYIHRNTLIYRLDKYSSLLDLDIRHFDDAMKLKIVLMINQLKALNKR